MSRTLTRLTRRNYPDENRLGKAGGEEGDRIERIKERERETNMQT